ncbi:collagen binding domain-containing protein [uncultured Ruminococcus sp.]|uniref:MSCRAMM family protein n=1 Tax=uncultured Ruminococcus sp. TaxID=165186 RepID=UPI00260C6285|nr:SpaA isopeptide-forming pilin-related protein [uncultured Ruminococcus sp.]
MKRKTLFKRLSSVAMALLLSLSALTQGITASAFSDTNKATQQWLNKWSYDFRGSGLPKGYDVETGKYNDTHFTGYYAEQVPYFTTSAGEYAYCINFDKKHTSGTVSKQQTLAEYIKSGHIPESMQRQIRTFCIYSYKGKTQYGYSKDIELCASTVMSQAVSARFFDESTTGLSDNETKLLNSYKYNGSGASAQHKKLVECYKKIKAEMLSHYSVPSGTSKVSYGKPLDKASYPATYNPSTGKWTAKLKLDSLSQFSVSKPNSVTVTRSGSNMTITADKAENLKNTVITLTKTKGKYVSKIDECSPLILSGTNTQEMIVSCYEDKDPVKAYLKITTANGTARLDKSFVDYFGNAQSATTNMYQAVHFNLIHIDGSSRYYVNANGSNGSYSFSSTGSQAQATAFGLDSSNGNLTVSGLPEGTYEWHEISTYPSYGTGSAQTFTVSADTTASCRFVNRSIAPDKGKLVIIKHNGSGEFLSGAVFEITAAEDIVINGYTVRHAGDLVDTVTTDANGRAETDKNIFRGYSYTITEIKAPVGYSRSAQPQTVKLATTVPEFEVSVSNSTWSVPVEITKKDVSTGELIPGCTFEITDENGTQIVTGVTDENGVAHFNLGYGKYFYHEIAAPEIYEIDDTPYPFEITEEGVTFKAEMTDKKKTGEIKVTKTTVGNLNIANIKFIATGISESNKGIKLEAETDETGVAHFDKLVVGKYIISEDGSTVPAAYLVADEQEVTVKYNKTVEVSFDNSEKVGSVKVVKATEGNLNIANIKFILSGTSDSGREINLESLTDENGIANFTNIPVGKYTISEDGSTVPAAYLTADEQKVTVEYNKTVEVSFENSEKTGSVKVVKTTEGNLNIANIKFILSGTSDSGREISFESLTDENGIANFTNIPVGKYTISEDGSTVPAAYLVADEQNVTVTEAATAEINIKNNEKTGTIKVHKTTEGNYNIANIKFFLKGTSDSGREINVPAVTDKNGVARFENVPIGTYMVVEDEKTVPYGYLVADEKEVTVTYAQTIDATILNNEMTGSITVHKTTEGQRNIEGIKFYLRGTSDTGREINIPATTDKDGIAKFENVPIGTYMAVEDEKTVPYGYLVADEKEVTVTYAQTIDETILNAEQTGTVQVHKKTDGMTNIEGIRFILSGVSDTGREIRIEAVTDKDGIARFEDVPVGTYTITEDGSTVPYGYLVADSKQVTVAYAQTVDTDMVNEKAPDTPNTGVTDNDIDGRTVLGGVVVILAGAAVVMFSRKRKER